MSQEEAKKFLIEQLSKIPSFWASTQMTPDEIREETKELSFEKLRNWLQTPGNKLDLSIKDVETKLFELIIYFIRDVEDDDHEHFFGNNVILDIPAQNRILKTISEWGVYNIQSLDLESFLELSKESF